MRSIFAGFILVLLICGTAFAQLEYKVADRLWESAVALDDLVKGKDAGIPKDLLKSADCVAVIPGAKKGALGFGGLYGKGTVTCRKDQGKGPFGSPSMISLGGGSFGFGVGGQPVDLVMLFMTPASMQNLLKDKFIFGSDAAGSAGPAGKNASGETDATHAEILTYAKSKGVFAGVSVKGSTLRQDSESNGGLYGKKVDAKALLVDGNVPVPEDAVKFINALTKATTN